MFHPIVGLALRVAIRRTGESKRIGLFRTRNIIDGMTDDQVEAQMAMFGVKPPKSLVAATSELSVGEFGDGSFLEIFKKWIEWFMSPEGQAFIKFIFGLFGLVI